MEVTLHPRAGKDFLSRRLMVLWRRSLTHHLHQLYLRADTFYHIQGGSQEVDNPDQRLTADVSSMLSSYQQLIQNDLFILPAATGYYAYKVTELWEEVHLFRPTVPPPGWDPQPCLASFSSPSSTSS